MTSLISIIAALLIILFGLMGVYSGHKFFKLYLAIVGLVFGFLFGMNLFNDMNAVSVIVSIIIGLIISALSFTFYKLAIFIAFAAIGASIGGWGVGQIFNVSGQAWVVIVGAVIGFIIGYFLLLAKIDKPVIIVLTCLLGAYYIISGVAGLVEGNVLQLSIAQDLLPTSLAGLNYLAGRAAGLIMSNIIYTGIYVFFVVTGLFNQLHTLNRRLNED